MDIVEKVKHWGEVATESVAIAIVAWILWWITTAMKVPIGTIWGFGPDFLTNIGMLLGIGFLANAAGARWHCHCHKE